MASPAGTPRYSTVSRVSCMYASSSVARCADTWENGTPFRASRATISSQVLLAAEVADPGVPQVDQVLERVHHLGYCCKNAGSTAGYCDDSTLIKLP